MKQKITFNNYLIKYKKYVNKLTRLQLTGRNLRRQNILKKHIARLEQKLNVLLLQLKPTRVATTLAVAGMLAINNNAQAQTFAEPIENPFGLTDVIGSYSSPAFVDLDDDGDLDILSGINQGVFYYFENITTENDASIVFDSVKLNLFSLSDIGGYSSPTFGDLDNDGDLDLLSGNSNGKFYYFENVTSETDAQPVFAAVQESPFNLTDIGDISAPTFVDLDNDGDLDLLSGDRKGNFYYFENITTENDSSIVFDTVQMNPFNLTDIGTASTPTFIDLDSDGDFDLLVGEYINGSQANFNYFENITAVTDTEPRFATVQENPFTLTGLDTGGDYNATVPAFGDLDGDGDLDLLSGHSYGSFHYFENTTINDGSLSTDDVIANEAELAVYPNPVSSIVTISVAKQFTINVVSVLNVLGKTVLTTVHNSNKATLQVEDLVSGIYVVNINTNKGAITQKLVIE